MKTIETERLLLRNWKDSDYLNFFEYASNPLVGSNSGSKTINMAALCKLISKKYNEEYINNDFLEEVED